MQSSASKCNRALPSAIEPICFGAQLRERYTLKSDIYQLSVLIAGPLCCATTVSDLEVICRHLPREGQHVVSHDVRPKYHGATRRSALSTDERAPAVQERVLHLDN